jgi:hypothetical protein
LYEANANPKTKKQLKKSAAFVDVGFNIFAKRLSPECAKLLPLLHKYLYLGKTVRHA